MSKSNQEERHHDPVLRELDQLRKEKEYRGTIIVVGVAILLFAFLLTSGISCVGLDDNNVDSANSPSGPSNTARPPSPLENIQVSIDQWMEATTQNPEDAQSWANLGSLQSQKVQILRQELQTLAIQASMLKQDPDTESQATEQEGPDTEQGNEANGGTDNSEALKDLEQEIETKSQLLESAQKKSQESLEKALEIDPNNSFALLEVSRSLLMKGEADQAKPYLETLVTVASQPIAEDEKFAEAKKAEQQTSLAQAYVALAQVAEQQGKENNEIISLLKKAKEADPSNPSAYSALAVFYSQNGDKVQAKKEYDILVNIVRVQGDPKAQAMVEFLGAQLGLVEQSPPPSEQSSSSNSPSSSN